MRYLLLILSSFGLLTSCASSEDASKIKEEVNELKQDISEEFGPTPLDAKSDISPKADFGPSPLDG